MLGKQRHGWIGIDVGASTLTLAQLRKRNGGVELSAAATVNRTPGGDPVATLQNDLDTVLAVAGDLRGKRTAAVLSMSSCRLDPGRAAMAGNDDDEACAGSWPTGIESNDPDAGWYTLSAAAGEARAVADGLLNAGLSCRVLDGAPQAISRAAGMLAAQGAPDATAVIDWGWSTATFCSAVNGYPVYVRPLKSSGLATAAATIVDELGLTPEEARDALTKHPPAVHESGGAESPLSQELARLVRPFFDHVLSEVQRTLTHVQTHRRQATPASLCLLGGGALLPGVERWLREKTGLPTRRWRPPGAEEGQQAWPLFGSAVALSALAWDPRR